MINPSTPIRIASMKSFSRAASMITILVGGLVLLGWAFDISLLKSIIPGFASMKANSSLGFILAGLALWQLLRAPATQQARYVIQVLAFGIALLGLLTLCEYTFGWQLGIDQWLFKDLAGGGSNPTPGRMSLTTALNFLFLGVALVFLSRETPLGDRVAHFLGLMIVLLSGVALLGYTFEAVELSDLGAYNLIAVDTALTFILAAAGLLCAYPDRGLMTIITGENAGSLVSRRLLPAAIILPAVLGWFCLQGQLAGLYDFELGLAFMVGSIIVVFVGVIWWNARVLNQTDAELKFALAADLRQSEERLRYVVWATKDAVWDRNILSAEILWNESLQKLFHYRADEIESSVSWWEEHIHPEDRGKVVRSIQSILETNQQLWSKEYRFLRADGSYANIFDRGYILYGEQSGQPERMIGAMADITEQKQVEHALRQSEELFAKAFSASPAGITLTRKADGRVIEANDAYLKMVGYRRSEVLGQTTLELGVIFAEDRARLLQIFEDQGAVRDFEHWVRTKSGQLKAVFSSLEQVEVDGTTCFLAIIYDITGRKQAEEALHDANEKLRHGSAELDQRNHEIVLLNELGNLLQTCQAPEEAYAIISQLVPKIFPNAPGALYMISASRDVVEAAATWKTLAPGEGAFAPKNCLALRRGQTHFITEEHAGLQCKHVVGSPASSICVPMMAQGEALGIFHLQSTASPGKVVEDLRPIEQGLAETVADTIALALTNLRLRETLRNQSIRDPLTGLFNLRFMEESLERELRQAARNQRSVGTIMLDLDHFKDFNDTFGHAAGDTLLRELGNFLKDRIRGGDIACRYGGEEFLLILPEASLENTRQRAQKLCDEIHHLQVQHQGQMLGAVTLSLGVAVFPDHGQLAEDVVRAADAALYRAKHEGRSRVAIAEST